MVLIDVPIIQAATKLCNARLIRIDNNRGGAQSVDSKMKVRRNCVNLPMVFCVGLLLSPFLGLLYPFYQRKAFLHSYDMGYPVPYIQAREHA